MNSTQHPDPDYNTGQRREQQTFLLHFSDRLRTQPNPDALATCALQLLTEQLQLDRCFIATYQLAKNRGDITHQVGNDQVPPLPPSIRLSDFPDAFRIVFEGTLVIDEVGKTEGLTEVDRKNMGALGFGALVSATLRQGERHPHWVISAISARPRLWTPAEIKLIEDVTERTWTALERARAEQALQQSEEKYRTLFDSIDEGYFLCEVIVDETDKAVDLLYIDANPAAGRMVGSDFTGRRLRAIDPSYEDYWYEIFGHTARTGEPQRLERYAAPDQRWYSFYIFKIGDQASRRIAVIFQDITARKQTEQVLRESEERYRRLSAELEARVHQRTQELSQANADLQRSNDNLQQFAYVASHDLQEPLRKIQSFSALVIQQLDEHLNESNRSYLQRITAAGARMSLLIKDLLAYSRIATRQQAFGPVSLMAIMQDVLTTLDWEIQQTNAQIELAELPVVKGDESQLGQLFQNLLTNALKFVRPGHPPVIAVEYRVCLLADLPIEVQPSRQVPFYHQISVVDDGVGFDLKFRERIFQVFQRLHGKNEYSGSGVGLAIVQRVVENHGGGITAQSQPGQGATFCAYLPA